MNVYSASDYERRLSEAAKSAQLPGAAPDERSDFSRDRARVLHSAALRRLADKTQVVGPRDGDTPRTRLTHSLEVAQIARGIGSGLGLDPDLCELAGLCHDIGHPPYGHNGEVALNTVAQDAGGFEGNAQTLRIITRLEPKVLDAAGNSYGLNLSRAAIDASCKYPWTASEGRRKYGAYDEDREILRWARAGVSGQKKCMEAQVMDFSDDVAYSVHDVEDGILSGRIRLGVLWDLVELAALAQQGAHAFGGSPEELIDAADRLRQLSCVAQAADFDGSLRALTGLKAMTSQLVGRYVGAAISATLNAHDGAPLGRHHGELVVSAEVAAEVRMLKTIAVLYVMEEDQHQRRQTRQRNLIYRVYDYLHLSAPGSLDPMFAAWYTQAENEQQRQRVLVDQIASMTESRLERTARNAADISVFYC
ncbi:MULTISPECIES: deoxyguanosinetriphosphate triphosphohydrolase [unclassified Corynebacterium]|uniref:deoxyguanosinetriphosphate triphosphohydrolase n=1 Tax=unclassified Corynebacterium TaxID=2624378 RepID=UPI001C44DE6C|nr:deoxyguanosinetriphosphate triphosphohydrolase [Corynebacterium sp. TAE3-ERU30]MBV7301396.1 deoxyguanosinetriphosphate triphosphohydrolase [Corynebacterium sp. TAE3-ERU2]